MTSWSRWRTKGGPSYRSFDLIWTVVLNVLGEGDRVVDIVCEKLRSEKPNSLTSRMLTRSSDWLASVYPPESSQNARVASAIEEAMRTANPEVLSRELLGLAAIDRGPAMKQLLLANLEVSSNPHWAAEALTRYFNDDDDVIAQLRSVLLGDHVRASMIANVAMRVLSSDELIPHLMELLRTLSASTDPGVGRPDIVASALVETLHEEGPGSGTELESVIAEAVELLPTKYSPFRSDMRYGLAAAAYPYPTSKVLLGELAEVGDPPLELYLRVFRDEPDALWPYLKKASDLLSSLPAYLRAQVCESLAERVVDPETVLSLTDRWADEESEPNKSIASLAYHRALLRAREEGKVDDERWVMRMDELGEQAVYRGFDYESRRRAAWVGMCVCSDWSMLKEYLETTGRESSVSVQLSSVLYGLDRVLLQQMALRWGDLRSEFGDALFTFFTREIGSESSRDVWNTLALVAPLNLNLQRELENAIADDPELLRQNGVLVWFIARGSTDTSAVADTLITNLRREGWPSSLASVIVTEYERFGLRREDLLARLEEHLQGVPADVGDPAIESLAALCPEHTSVLDTWRECSKLIADSRYSQNRTFHPSTFLAVSYATADSSAVVEMIERNLVRLGQIGDEQYDSLFMRHVSRRLRRDPLATEAVREVVINKDTPDLIAAQLVSILSDSVGMDEILLDEIERRITSQRNVRLAPVARDCAVSATLSVQNIFARVSDVTWDVGTH